MSKKLRIAVTRLPGFDESLRLLLEHERYSRVDVAMMFGVSRERVGQWCVARGLKTTYPSERRGILALRVWDDNTHRFRPRPRGEVRREHEAARVAQRRASRARKIAERRRWIVEVVQQLRRDLGRDPFWSEMWVAIGGDPARSAQATPLVLGRWGWGRNRISAATLRDFRRATGIGPLPRGEHAHQYRRTQPSNSVGENPGSEGGPAK